MCDYGLSLNKGVLVRLCITSSLLFTEMFLIISLISVEMQMFALLQNCQEIQIKGLITFPE